MSFVRAGLLPRAVLLACTLSALCWNGLSERASSLTHALSRDVLQGFPRPHRPPPPFTLVAADRPIYAPVEPFHGDDHLLLARAVERATALGARAIVVTPVLDRAGEPASDAALEDALRRSARAYLCEDLVAGFWGHPERNAAPLARFAHAARGVGHALPEVDIDAVPRRWSYGASFDGRRHPALAELLGPVPEPARDRYGAVLLDLAAVGPIPRVPLERLLAGASAAADLKPLFEGRVVVLGQVDPTAVQWHTMEEPPWYGEPDSLTADEITARALAAFSQGASVRDLGPSLGAWPVVALLAVTCACWCLDGAAPFVLLLALLAGTWALAGALAWRGMLLDAWAVSRGLVGIACARALDRWLARRARLARLSALFAESARRTNDPGQATAVGGGRGGLDVALLAELLPERFTNPVLIGQGGMGMVCRVYDRQRRGEVALKLLRPSAHLTPATRARFHAEVKLLAGLKHPGVVQLFDVELGSIPFFTMELLSGESLDNRLARGPLAPLAAVLAVREIAEVLAFLHAKGIVHRDLKPSNVMVLEDGSLKVLDLGVARHGDSAGLTVTGEVIGTMAYMPPEQLGGAPATPPCDVYSAGVVLCEALTGRVPERDGATHDVPRDALAAHGASPELIALIARLLEPRPSRRPPDGAALLEALDAVAPTVEPAHET